MGNRGSTCRGNMRSLEQVETNHVKDALLFKMHEVIKLVSFHLITLVG